MCISPPLSEECCTWHYHGDCNRAVVASFVIAADGVVNYWVVTGRLMATIAPSVSSPRPPYWPGSSCTAS